MRGSARSWSSISRTALRSPGSGGGGVSPSQVPSPQAARPVPAAVASSRRRRDWRITSRPAGAAPPIAWSSSAARLCCEGGDADLDAQLLQQRSAPCPARRPGSRPGPRARAPGCARARRRRPAAPASGSARPGRRCRAGARPRAAGRDRAASGSSGVAAASASRAADGPRLVLQRQLRLRLLQPRQRREAGLALGGQRREPLGRLGLAVGRERRPRRRRSAAPRRPARAARHWSQPTLPAVPTTTSTARATTRVP